MPSFTMPVVRKPRNKWRETQRNADWIDQYGSPVDFPCDGCADRLSLCVMTEKFKKCSECTRHGRSCLNRPFSSNEWNKQRRDEMDASSKLATVDADIAHFQREVELARIRLRGKEDYLSRSLLRHAHLRQKQEVLRDRGAQMASHDSSILPSSDPSLTSPDLVMSDADFNALMRDFGGTVSTPGEHSKDAS